MCSPSEEGDPLSPSRWTEVQSDDDVWGQAVREDMALLPVVRGVDTGAFGKAVCWRVSAPPGFALCPRPPTAWLFSQ